MSKAITIKCPACHHSFEVNLADYEVERVVYKGVNDKKERVEEYRFQCPRDEVYFIVPVTIEE